MKHNQFVGGLFEFHSNVGGVCCFESRVAKMGGGSTFFIKYGLIIEYICNFFAFLGWFQKNFFSKFSPAQSIWGGCTLSTCILGGVQMGSAENGGVSIRRQKGAKLVHPPPLDVFDTFPYAENNELCLCDMANVKKNGLCSSDLANVPFLSSFRHNSVDWCITRDLKH